MYCDFFGFKQEPFSIAPDPAFLYPSAKHRQALAHLKYGLDREGGFILLTGEVGTGKTTLTRLLLEQTPAAFRVAYILNAKLDVEDVLASICDELDIQIPDSRNLSPKTYIDAINGSLLEAHAQGLKTLVVIEEAQNLAEDVLETLRLLTNLETNTTKLLHILLVGQPELLELIAQPQLRQLNQRVVSRFHIPPLNRAETESYLQHRLRKAGCGRPLFDRSAIDRLQRLSDGIPRKINLLAERALLGAYSQDREKVSRSQIDQAQKEVFGDAGAGRSANQRLWVIVALLGFVVCFFWYLNQSGLVPEVPSTGALKPLAEAVSEQASEPSPSGNLPAAEEDVSNLIEQQDAYDLLLSLWGIEADVGNVEALCIQAAAENLRCEVLQEPQVDELFEINRPILLELQIETASSPESYVLQSVSGEGVQLYSAEGVLELQRGQLDTLLQGEAHYLWRPPLGFTDLLTPGESNWAVMNWLQPRLVDIDPELAQLITGGRYSQPIANGVAEFQRRNGLEDDGLLGRRTLMKFNQVEGGVPLLVEE